MSSPQRTFPFPTYMASTQEGALFFGQFHWPAHRGYFVAGHKFERLLLKDMMGNMVAKFCPYY